MHVIDSDTQADFLRCHSTNHAVLLLLLGGSCWLWSSCLWGPVCSWVCNKACGSRPPSHIHTLRGLWSYSWPHLANHSNLTTSPLWVGWQTQGTGRKEGRGMSFHWPHPRCGLSVYVAGMCCTYSRHIEGIKTNREVCVCVSQNEPLTVAWLAYGPWTAEVMSHVSWLVPLSGHTPPHS